MKDLIGQQLMNYQLLSGAFWFCGEGSSMVTVGKRIASGSADNTVQVWQAP